MKILIMTMTKILELFAGSRSFGKVAEKNNEVFSVDWTNYKNIDLVKNIANLKISDIPFIPDFIWCSPDCTTYSIAAIKTHRKNTIEPVSDYAKECDKTNKHFISLIETWLKINPNLIYFIENPRGAFRHMPFVSKMKRHTVWYCQYGDDRAKPTDIFTNYLTWHPKPVCRNYKYDKQGKIINKHCHHQSSRRGSKTGTQGIKGSYSRSLIPELLCQEILESVTND